jgi:hypothetical protein
MKARTTPTWEECEPFISPLIPDLLGSFWEAWHFKDALLSGEPRASMILKSSTVAGVVSDAFGFFAFPRLIARKDTRSRQIGRSQLAVVQETCLVRFKKFTPDLHAMAIHTGQQSDISYQQETLPNGRKLISINLGYTPSRSGSIVTGIYLACPNGWNKNHWVRPIYQADDGQLDMFGGAPIVPSGQDDVNEILNVDIRVKRRKGKQG